MVVGKRSRWVPDWLRRGTILVGLVVPAIATPRPAQALDPYRALTQYIQDKWDTRDGLPRNYVKAILQTLDSSKAR